MERIKNRIVSIILAIILLGNLVMLIPFASSALLDTETTYAQYLADYYVSRSSLSYHLYENKMPYHDYTSDVDSDMEKAVNTWRAVTMDLGDYANYSDKEVEFYILLVFDVAYQITNEKSVLENANTGAKAIQASTLLELGKMSAETAMEISAETEVTKENMQEVFNRIVKCKAMTKVAAYSDKILKCVEYAGNVEELIEKLCMINEFVACSDVLAEILDDMYASATDPVLKEALREMSLMATGLLSDAEIITIFGGNIALQDMKDYALGQLWDQLAKKLPILQSISLGQGMGKLACNLLFSTDAVVENWYSMHKVAIFENDLRKCLKTYVTNYKNSPTHANAIILNKAVEVFYGTMSAGMEYAYKFAEASKGGGIFGWFYKTFNTVKYEKTLNSLAQIKKIIDTDMYFANNETYNLYLELMEDSTSATGEYMPVWQPTPCTVTEQEVDEQQIVVVEELYRMKDQVVSTTSSMTSDKETYGKFTVTGGTLSLNENTLTVGEDYYITGGTVNVGTGKLVIEGDLYIKGGTLELQEGSVTVAGNVYHSDGTMNAMRGSLNVAGDYRLATRNVNEYGEITWDASEGYLKMTESDGTVTVGGMFFTKAEYGHSSCLTAGTMYVAGDFYQYNANTTSSYQNFKTASSHKVVLNGTAVQNVYLQSSAALFSVLEIANETGISAGGYFAATSLTSSLETAKIQSQDMIIGVLGVDAPYVEITGDVTKIADTLSLGSNKLKIDGNLTQSSGTVDTKRGALEITGDYRIAAKIVNEYGEISWGESDGYLKMTESDAAVTVGGMFLTKSKYGHGSWLTAGTMYVAGDFCQYNVSTDGSKQNFKTAGSHKVVLNGAAVQNVYLQSNAAIITVLEIANEAGISSGGYFAATSLVSSLETARIQSQDMMIRVLTVDAPYVEITGDVTKVTDTLSLGTNKLKIDGDFIHSSGMVDTKRGALEVTGDYRVATKNVNEYGDISWDESEAYLKMTESDAVVTVGGMFSMKSKYGHSAYLTAGTMYVAGDFFQYNASTDGSKQNFKSSGSHKVVLNGTALQYVYLQSNAAVFTVLEIANEAGISAGGYFAATSLTSSLETAKIQSKDMMIRVLTVDAPYVEITGEVTKVTDTMSLGSNKLKIVGDLVQSAGTVDTKRGTLEVTGDYRVAAKIVNEYGEISWDDSEAYLKMTESDAVVTVGGMFFMKSKFGHSSYLTAGTMYIEGDFYQYNASTDGSKLNFKTSGSHTVYLNGTAPQNVYFQSSSSKFTILHPTQSLDRYTFSPAVCWTTLHGTTTSQVIAPDCDTPGCTLYTCTICGGTYEEDPVDMLGHDYQNGICTVCGVADPDYVAPVTVDGKSFTLSFEDEILVNFYYTVSHLTDVVEHGMLVFYSDPGAVDYANADAVYNEPAYDSTKNRYMATTVGIAAKEMGDTRYYVGYAKLTDGTYVYSTMYDYSPKKYSVNMLGKTSTTDKQKALCVAMLNYGAAAQTYFGYNTDSLMNAELTAEQQALVVAYDASYFTGAVAADSSKTGNFTATSTGFSKRTATVSFEGAFCVNYYFTPNATVSGDMTLYIWTPEDYAATTKLTTSNASETMTMVAGSDGRYWGQVSGIAAKSLDETYYVAGVYTDADGNTCCTGVIAYSLSKYCLSKAVDGNEMQELAAATAMYGYYAKLYFTN